ncbi:MAG: hypothetical protein R2991_14640 [Thermoanaerobaculia bacterium]
MALLFAATVLFTGRAVASAKVDAALPARGTVVGKPVPGRAVDIDLRRLPTLSPWATGDPEREMPRNVGRAVESVRPRIQSDTLLELQAESSGPGPILTVVQNFEGGSSAVNPNDPTGDIGNAYFIEAVNGNAPTNSSAVTLYDKGSGSVVLGPFALETLAPSGPCTQGLGEPVVLFDHLAGRWVLTEVSDTGNRLCVYTSRTADPVTGGWCFYEFQDDQFPDSPSWGVWPTLYAAATNKNSQGPDVYALDRVNMLSLDGVGCPTARPTQRFENAPNLPGLAVESFTPVDLDGPAPPPGTPAYFVRHRDEELNGDPSPDPSTDRVELWALSVDFDNAGNSTFSQEPDLVLADFDSNLCPPIIQFECVPQPDGAARLDPILELVMLRASYRNFGNREVILGTFQVDAGDFQDHVAQRWFEARRTGGGAFALFQEGTYAPDAEHRFIGATAMDRRGDILLSYNVSSESVYPGSAIPAGG